MQLHRGTQAEVIIFSSEVLLRRTFFHFSYSNHKIYLVIVQVCILEN